MTLEQFYLSIKMKDGVLQYFVSQTVSRERRAGLCQALFKPTETDGHGDDNTATPHINTVFVHVFDVVGK